MSRAKKLYKAASVQSEETIIDDSNDMLYIVHIYPKPITIERLQDE